MARQEKRALLEENAALERLESQLRLLCFEIGEQRAFYFHNGLEQTVGQSPAAYLLRAQTHIETAIEYSALRRKILEPSLPPCETLEEKIAADCQPERQEEAQ